MLPVNFFICPGGKLPDLLLLTVFFEQLAASNNTMLDRKTTLSTFILKNLVTQRKATGRLVKVRVHYRPYTLDEKCVSRDE